MTLIVAEMQLEAGNIDEAVNRAHEVLKESKLLGIQELTSRACGLLGFIAGSAGRPDLALGWWSQSLQIMQQQARTLPEELSPLQYLRHPVRRRIRDAAAWLAERVRLTRVTRLMMICLGDILRDSVVWCSHRARVADTQACGAASIDCQKNGKNRTAAFSPT